MLRGAPRALYLTVAVFYTTTELELLTTLAAPIFVNWHKPSLLFSHCFALIICQQLINLLGDS